MIHQKKTMQMYPLGRLPLPRKPVVRDDHSTNWNADGRGTSRGSGTCTFGEGYGNNLLLDPPKYVAGKLVGKTYSPEILEEMAREAQENEEAEQEAKIERRRQGTMKAKLTRALNQERARQLRIKEAKGAVLKGRRVFLLQWLYEDWGERGANLGLPEGTQMLETGFGGLLVVPVIEQLEGEALGLKNPTKDVEGRRFWVTTEVRERMEWVFGKVMWDRPITVREATKEFKVKSYLFGGTC